MFSTKEQLEKRTPKGGIKREDYINLLASEFYETSNAGKLRYFYDAIFFFFWILFLDILFFLFLFTFKNFQMPKNKSQQI